MHTGNERLLSETKEDMIAEAKPLNAALRSYEVRSLRQQHQVCKHVYGSFFEFVRAFDAVLAFI